MKRLILLVCAGLALSSAAQDQVLTATPFARGVLRSTNAADFASRSGSDVIARAELTNATTSASRSLLQQTNVSAMRSYLIPDGSLSMSAFGSTVATNYTYMATNYATLVSGLQFSTRGIASDNGNNTVKYVVATNVSGYLHGFVGIPSGMLISDHIYCSMQVYSTATNATARVGFFEYTNTALALYGDTPLSQSNWTTVTYSYAGGIQIYRPFITFLDPSNAGLVFSRTNDTFIVSNLTYYTYNTYYALSASGDATATTFSQPYPMFDYSLTPAPTNVDKAVNRLLYPWDATNVAVLIQGDSKASYIGSTLLTLPWWSGATKTNDAVGGTLFNRVASQWQTNLNWFTNATSAKVKLYVLWTGHNEMAATNASDAVAYWSNHLAAVRSSGVLPIVLTTAPGTFGGTNQWLYCATINNFIRNSPLVWRVIDTEPAFQNCYNANNDYDYLHPSPTAISNICESITRAVCARRELLPEMWSFVHGSNTVVTVPLSNSPVPVVVEAANSMRKSVFVNLKTFQGVSAVPMSTAPTLSQIGATNLPVEWWSNSVPPTKIASYYDFASNRIDKVIVTYP
jgi:hypothetical protein